MLLDHWSLEPLGTPPGLSLPGLSYPILSQLPRDQVAMSDTGADIIPISPLLSLSIPN